MRNIFIIALLYTINVSGQCPIPNNLNTTNVNYFNAEVNWVTGSAVDHYRIRYKEISASNWTSVNNVDSNLTTKLLTNLQPLSYYIYKIRSYCDTINSNFSSWSVLDTFYTNTSNCPNTSNLYTSNINYYNAIANWDTIINADRYKVRYKILGTTSWSNLGPIYHPNNAITIPLLQQNTQYEWQVMTFHDTTTLLASLWSASDTFLTTSFIPAPFNPQTNNTLYSLDCNEKTTLYLNLTQAADEPDIGNSIITSDGGYFDIGSINSGDSIGYAIMTTSNQIIEAELRTGIILGNNYAIVNSYDSTNTLIGFFTIENQNGGIKISSSTPNDGNNYTSGYVSDLFINNLFVNPPNSGPLHFYAEINSELSDQVFTSDTFQISCVPTTLENHTSNKKIESIYDYLGKKVNTDVGLLRIYRYSDGTIKKRIIID